MDSYQETFETWDKVALLYQEKFMNLSLYNETYDSFCNLLSIAKPKVLEIGTGPGNISKYILTKNSNLQIHGIDIAPNMINLARINNPAATFSVLDARSIQELKTQFDGIISGFCIPYMSVSETETFISNSKKLLNKNGIFYLSYVDGDNSNSGFITGKNGDRVFFYYHDTKDIVQFQKSNDFEIIKQYKIPYLKNDSSSEIHTVIISISR